MGMRRKVTETSKLYVTKTWFSRTHAFVVDKPSIWTKFSLVWHWGVWYMHLKTENCCLKTCIEIHVSKKCVNIYIMLFKNWKLLFENMYQTPLENLPFFLLMLMYSLLLLFWIFYTSILLFKRLSLFRIFIFFVQKCPYTSMFMYKQN